MSVNLKLATSIAENESIKQYFEDLAKSYGVTAKSKAFKEILSKGVYKETILDSATIPKDSLEKLMSTVMTLLVPLGIAEPTEDLRGFELKVFGYEYTLADLYAWSRNKNELVKYLEKRNTERAITLVTVKELVELEKELAFNSSLILSSGGSTLYVTLSDMYIACRQDGKLAGIFTYDRMGICVLKRGVNPFVIASTMIDSLRSKGTVIKNECANFSTERYDTKKSMPSILRAISGRHHSKKIFNITQEKFAQLTTAKWFDDLLDAVMVHGNVADTKLDYEEWERCLIANKCSNVDDIMREARALFNGECFSLTDNHLYCCSIICSLATVNDYVQSPELLSKHYNEYEQARDVNIEYIDEHTIAVHPPTRVYKKRKHVLSLEGGQCVKKDQSTSIGDGETLPTIAYLCLELSMRFIGDSLGKPL